ncbi:cytochrome b561 [Serratia sp. NPDC078593]|uniref:cytochrome b561 n=1 Tax=unclassified Serratia (in: enterobacteria) TaxID=2647522 RepID=UPI0037D6DC3B
MNTKFSRVQILLHWAIFILIVFTYAAMELKGLTQKGSNGREWMNTTHYTLGFTVFVLMIFRVYLKIKNKYPPIHPQPPRWQIILAKTMHGVLYLIFISLPIFGVLSLYYGSVEWSFFSYVMPIADVKNSNMQHNLKEIHELVANAGYFIIGLHAAAALFHHYIIRDNTLIRMSPGK